MIKGEIISCNLLHYCIVECPYSGLKRIFETCRRCRKLFTININFGVGIGNVKCCKRQSNFNQKYNKSQKQNSI